MKRSRTTTARSALLLGTVLLVAGCGDRITPAQLEDLSRTTSEVLVAVQQVADSTRRHAIADSVARANGYGGWEDLREELGVVATEPDRLRALLDTTHRRLEAQTR